MASRCEDRGALTPLCDSAGGRPAEGPPTGTPGSDPKDSGLPTTPSDPDGDGGVSAPACIDGLKTARADEPGAFIGGSVTGLTENGLELLLNRTVVLKVPKGATTFAFPIKRPTGSHYEVALKVGPSALVCTVVGGVGRVTSQSGVQNQASVTCAPHPAIREMAVGTAHVCILLSTGQVRCWGSDAEGQLGNSTPQSSVPGLEHVSQIALGQYHTCVLLEDSTVRCWGFNPDGQTGGGSTSASIKGLSGVAEVKVGGSHTCARLLDGTVRCWGADKQGQVAGASMTQSIAGLSGVVGLALGTSHTCALRQGGTVRCWGDDSLGQAAGSSLTADIDGLSGVIAIAANGNITCAVREGGKLRCFGENKGGSLGGSSAFDDVFGLSGVAQVAVGAHYNVWVRLLDGSVKGWGNGYAMPGAAFQYPKDVVELGAGADFACARTRNHEVSCWGASGVGFASSYVPQRIEGLSGVVELHLSPALAGAAMADGTARIWGFGRRNIDGARGVAPLDPILGVSAVRQVLVDNGSAIVVVSDGTLRAAGLDIRVTQKLIGFQDGPFGNLSGVVEGASSSESACVVLADSSVRCWGGSQWMYGESSLSTSIPGLSGVTAVRVGRYLICALLSDATVRCWGDAKSLGGSSLSTSIPGLSGVVQLDAGFLHGCAVTREGEVRCWGTNAVGQTAASTPTTPVAGLTGVTRIAAGWFHNCALLRDGTVRCWGANAGPETGGSSPTKPVPFVEGAIDIAAGGQTSCAILCGGRVLCWGADNAGQASGAGEMQRVVIPVTP